MAWHASISMSPYHAVTCIGTDDMHLMICIDNWLQLYTSVLGCAVRTLTVTISPHGTH